MAQLQELWVIKWPPSMESAVSFPTSRLRKAKPMPRLRFTSLAYMVNMLFLHQAKS